jgi:hypothetical protein
MALPPLELFFLRKWPPEFQVAISTFASIPAVSGDPLQALRRSQ